MFGADCSVPYDQNPKFKPEVKLFRVIFWNRIALKIIEKDNSGKYYKKQSEILIKIL